MIHENTLQLTNSLNSVSNAPIRFRDLADVRTALQGQMKVCDVLENLSGQVMELIARGNELIRQPSVPKYVQQDVQNIQKLYNEKVEIGQDYLSKLKVNISKDENEGRKDLIYSLAFIGSLGTIRCE